MSASAGIEKRLLAHMSKSTLALLPDARRQYEEDLRTATPKQLDLAYHLQVAAGHNIVYIAPVYLRQALWLTKSPERYDAICKLLKEAIE